MKAFPKRHDDVATRADRVKQWMDARRKKDVEVPVNAVHSKGFPLQVVFGAASIVGALAAYFCALSALITDGRRDAAAKALDVSRYSLHFADYWPAFGTVALVTSGIACALCLISLITMYWRSKSRDALRAAKRAVLMEEFTSHPLVRRGTLILEAVAEYRLHCERYRAWREQVDDDLVASDPEAEDRWHSFLIEAHDVLTSAIANFEQVAEHLRREEEFIAEHREPAALDTAPEQSLAALLEELRAELDQPPLPESITDPTRALARDENLRRVTRELRTLERAG